MCIIFRHCPRIVVAQINCIVIDTVFIILSLYKFFVVRQGCIIFARGPVSSYGHWDEWLHNFLCQLVAVFMYITYLVRQTCIATWSDQ